MKNRKTSIIALVALLVVALVGSTVAYWSQSSSIENPFDTNTYGSTVVEKFSPQDGEDWQPGVKVNKDVTVKNEGTTDILVRAKLTESWTNKTTGKVYATQVPNGVYTVQQADNGVADGKTDDDLSVVWKHFDTGTKWTTTPDKNGWFYYTENLKGDNVTDKWLDAVELDKDVDMGLKVNTFYVATDKVKSADAVTNWYKLTGSTDKVPQYVTISGTTATAATTDTPNRQAVTFSKQETRTDETLTGYSNSNYVLTVTVETVQATQEALDATFGGGNAFAIPAGCEKWTLRDTVVEPNNN